MVETPQDKSEKHNTTVQSSASDSALYKAKELKEHQQAAEELQTLVTSKPNEIQIEEKQEIAIPEPIVTPVATKKTDEEEPGSTSFISLINKGKFALWRMLQYLRKKRRKAQQEMFAHTDEEKRSSFILKKGVKELAFTILRLQQHLVHNRILNLQQLLGREALQQQRIQQQTTQQKLQQQQATREQHATKAQQPTQQQNLLKQYSNLAKIELETRNTAQSTSQTSQNPLHQLQQKNIENTRSHTTIDTKLQVKMDQLNHTQDHIHLQKQAQKTPLHAHATTVASHQRQQLMQANRNAQVTATTKTILQNTTKPITQTTDQTIVEQTTTPTPEPVTQSQSQPNQPQPFIPSPHTQSVHPSTKSTILQQVATALRGNTKQQPPPTQTTPPPSQQASITNQRQRITVQTSELHVQTTTVSHLRPSDTPTREAHQSRTAEARIRERHTSREHADETTQARTHQDQIHRDADHDQGGRGR